MTHPGESLPQVFYEDLPTKDTSPERTSDADTTDHDVLGFTTDERQTIRELVQHWEHLTGGMADRRKAGPVISAAVKSHLWPAERIREALDRLVASPYGLTKETLRRELQADERQAQIHALRGRMSPAFAGISTTDMRIAQAQALKGQFSQLDRNEDTQPRAIERNSSWQ